MSEKVSLNDLNDQELEERVIHIDRVKKTVKGGDIISFRAIVAVGNKDGVVGFAMGKARATPEAIAKGFEKARKNLWRIPLDGVTIPHQVQQRVGGAVVFMKPASRGTGVIAGGPVRAVVELAGIHDILSKCLGSNTPVNNAAAAFECLKSLVDARKVAELRGRTVEEILGEAELCPDEDTYAIGVGADEDSD